MTTISTKPLNNVSFLVSNVRLSKYTKSELENLELKESRQQGIETKMIKLETETRIVHKENKRIKEDYQVYIQYLENHIIKLEK
ncbi:12366_t:CDS:2, partial [Racocetra fulgida]